MLKNITNIIQNYCSYDNINKEKNLVRNKPNGIQINDVIYYRLAQSETDQTKCRIVCEINRKNNTTFVRQAYEKKERSIPVRIYEEILNALKNLYNAYYGNNNEEKLIAIDGTYNNDINMKDNLNMGFFSISDNIPIDITNCGKENKNKEIKSTIEYVNQNIDIFKNNIVVCDRGYYSYEFLQFLIDSEIKFIIRAKGDAQILQTNTKLYKSTPKYDTIVKLRKNVKIIKFDNVLEKDIYISNSKKKNVKHNVTIQNDCTLITNIIDDEQDDHKIMEIYKSRWDIEIFFKLIKSNLKFQHVKESDDDQIQKLYICDMIIIYISRLIDKYNENKNKIYEPSRNNKDYTFKTNKTKIIDGIFDQLLWKLTHNDIDQETINKFCGIYISIVQNKRNRSFPRSAKTPFLKWYVKGYSNETKYMKIINAILNSSVDKLNKNLKVIAKRIKSIDGTKLELK